MGSLKFKCQWNGHAVDNGRHVDEQIVENGFSSLISLWIVAQLLKYRSKMGA